MIFLPLSKLIQLKFLWFSQFSNFFFFFVFFFFGNSFFVFISLVLNVDSFTSHKHHILDKTFYKYRKMRRIFILCSTKSVCSIWYLNQWSHVDDYTICAPHKKNADVLNTPRSRKILRKCQISGKFNGTECAPPFGFSNSGKTIQKASKFWN